VWQAKFFLDGLDDAQKDQIRRSYASARGAASEHGYELVAWTLCVPCELNGHEQQWWDRWSAEREREDGVTMGLWDLAEFRQLLAKPDAADVRREYFPHLDAVHAPGPPQIEAVPGGAHLDELLFARQLREAGMVEIDSAKEQFYNAELVERDLADKGLGGRLALFEALRADLRSVWEDRFNHHCTTEAEGRLLPQLHPDVMDRVDRAHESAPSEPFPLTRIHRKGALHQVVDRGQAGWVRDFREVVRAHSAD
jgi:hypothetical protein